MGGRMFAAVSQGRIKRIFVPSVLSFAVSELELYFFI
jgi:hypothetical protein